LYQPVEQTTKGKDFVAVYSCIVMFNINEGYP